MESSNLEESEILKLVSPWANNDNNIWLASSLELYRNIDKYLFPEKLDTERKKQVISLVSKAILSLDANQSPLLIAAEKISPFAKQFLVEHFLTDYNFQNAHVGDAFIINQTGQLLTTINLQNHLSLKTIDCLGELENSWNTLLKMEVAIGKSIPFAFSPKFGFLTSNPGLCGTGLVVTVFLQLSALIHLNKLDEILDKHVEESIAITGIQGNPEEIIGDVLAIKNNHTLGLSEENIIATVRALTTKLLTEENRARNEIRNLQHAHIKDLVSRAFGIFVHSYQIEPTEALNAISLIKLGIEMGWITGVNYLQLNQLFFNSRRSHLLSNFGKAIPQEEIPHKRAEFIHEAFKYCALKI